MNKKYVNYLYNMREQLLKSVWFLSINISIMAIIYIALIKTGVFNEQGGGYIYRSWVATIFLFAIFIHFKDSFDFMLTLSMTRWEIFVGKIETAFTISFIFSLIILLERVVVDRMNNIFNFHNITDPLYFWSPYQTSNLFVMFIYFFMLCLCCSFVGILIGTLFYRFGNKFVTAFWLVFSAIPTVFLPFLMWTQYKRGVLGENMAALGKNLATFNVAQASGIMLILSLTIAAFTWLNMRRLSEK